MHRKFFEKFLHSLYIVKQMFDKSPNLKKIFFTRNVSLPYLMVYKPTGSEVITDKTLSLFFLDHDPCLNVTCDKFAVCRAFGAYDARCVCVTNCPSTKQNLCASHGKSYNNPCLYQLDVCQTRSNYSYYHHGSCRGGI